MEDALDMQCSGRITATRSEVQYGSCTVFGTIDGVERPLFSYYIDEINVPCEELIGKTVEETIQFKRELDVKYLRS